MSGYPWARTMTFFCVLLAAGLLCWGADWRAGWQRMLAYGLAGGVFALTWELAVRWRRKRARRP